MVDIVIVNWNSGALLAKCVNSVIAECNKSIVSCIIIIDNHSSDDSLQQLPLSEKIHLIRNEENRGFSKACNQGFQKVTAPYVLLLNPDTILFENTISDCLQYVTAHLNIDILGCQLLDENGNISTSCARFPTPLRFFYSSLGLSYLFPRIFTPPLLMTDWNHAESCAVDQVMGAFMFMPTSIFNKIGYFDERFFVYYEELDFSYRLRKANGISYFNASIKAIHYGMGTTESVKGYRLFLNLSSRLKYARKHFSTLGYWLVCVSVFPLELITRACLLCVKGRFAELKDLMKGYRLFFSNKK